MPILDEHTLDFISHGPEQTRRFGARLGALLQAGDLICLAGDLGTGKTCFVQGIGQGVGILEPITSPSFALVAEHRPPNSALVLYHVDVYRLDAPWEEAVAFGLEEYMGEAGVCVIEWADRIRAALPRERLWITLRHVDSGKRGIIMEATSSHYDSLMHRFRQSAFGI